MAFSVCNVGFLRKVYPYEWVAFLSGIALACFYLFAPVWQPFWIIFFGTFRLFFILVTLSWIILFFLSKVKKNVKTFQKKNWLDFFRMGLAFSMVETTHFILKAFIPLLNPSNYDGLFWKLDRLLFFNHQPQRWVQALASFPWFLQGLDLFYSSLYYFLVWGSVLFFLVWLSHNQIHGFMSSFCLFWQIGLLLYILFPAWGPVFTKPVLFEKAMAFMPHTYHVQSQLWQETAHVIRREFNFTLRYFGCAAFPSLHVGVLFLFLLWAWKNKSTRWFYLLAFLGIVAGSVITGYHYVADAPGGLFVAWSAYRLSQMIGHPTPSP